MTEYQINPELRSLIPPLHPSELKALEESIREDGVRDAIVTWNGYIVDGHNRWDIITKNKITDYKVVEKQFEDIEEAKIFIKKTQLARRNISLFLKAKYLLDIQEWQRSRTQAKENSLANLKQSSTEIVNSQNRIDNTKILAESLGVGTQKASRIIQIYENAPEEVKDKYFKGEISANKAYKQVKAPESEKKLDPERKQLPVINLPSTKYRTIVIDPPWPVSKSEKGTRSLEDSTQDSPVMNVDEIRKLPIQDIADQDCHIYLWTTHEFLPTAFGIFKSWGVKYHYLLTWVKNIGPTPVSWTFSTEHCLFGVKGNFERKEVSARVDFSAEAMEPSLKPQCFYEIVKSASSEPRIDLFSREPHEGFTAWDPRPVNPRT